MPSFFSLLMSAPTSATSAGASPFGRLVHQQEQGIGHQRPRNGQHLLLAAAQFVSAMMAAFGQSRK